VGYSGRPVAETFRNFIGGQWVPALSGETFPNVNPADTREVVGLFPRSGNEDARRAIEAAREAQPKWAAMPAPKRGEVMFKAASLLEARADAVARDMTREEGKTLPEARGEVGRAINILRYFAGEGSRLCGEAIPSERPRVFIHTIKKPLGVVGLITPWNFPVAIPAWKLAPALIAGNAVVLKPSDLAPLCSLRLMEVLDEAGVTKGAVNMVSGPGSKVGAELVSNPAVRALSFTGSEATGSQIAVEIAKRRGRVQLEMGGKNPTIVLKDADLAEAVEVVANAAFFSTGQKCTATSRVIVEEPILESFTKALVERVKRMKVGNGLEGGVEMGPSVDESQLRTVLEYVDIGKKEGAKVVCGGQRLDEGALAHGFFSSPAVLTEVTPKMRVAQEEIFGPVAAILPARDIDDAVAIANDIRFGLSASICTRSLTAAFEFINRIEAGLVMVNLPSAGVEYQVPFGGSKSSSMGMREQGAVAVDFYTEMKTVYLKY
jgi:acyl-CoA reductase-like NAD-dependent aldehyde dehydrogenase